MSNSSHPKDNPENGHLPEPADKPAHQAHSGGHDCGHDCGHDHTPKAKPAEIQGAGACCGHDHHHAHPSALDGPEENEWTRRFFLFLELVVLLIWAVMMVWIFASGRITEYLIGEGTFRIQVLAAGLLLAVLGLFNWQMRGVPDDCGHDHEDGGSCGHHHAGDEGGRQGQDPPVVAAEAPLEAAVHYHEGTPAGRGMALVLLAVSVTTAVALTPDQFSDQYKRNMLSAYSQRTGSVMEAPDAYRLTPQDSPTEKAAGGMTLAVVEKYRPRNKDGNFELGVEELYYSSADPEYAKVMTGQGVETIGQVVKDTSSDEPGRWRVFVLQMTCCAADARPVSLPVVFEGAAPELQEMGWFKLTGKLDYVEERGITVAVLRATAAQPSLRPKEQRTLF